ncbi:sodium/potassium/calcium exchanger 4-like [Pectinophora gossypiella]|uniref:sodium/potassium/calcium exchanger 4-like n=1 Tax=Pectinophora gossypiella TaxID=13191 RepID=UPI00214ECCA4|nr:sodium/potassium/calcium exchanger 4-like [Pectinophora gossypiella]XP_049884655.1 sodium/potassium/calcium exchanger 4-like [Pectinophora gossypiella]XP_049884656.1 sodium/potassium/calcium exchanger 4-like [Pectinophora gossypiella]
MTRKGEIILFTSLVLCSFASAFDFDIYNVTKAERPGYVIVTNKNGDTVYMSEELMRKLNDELETWHWTPWLRTRTAVQNNQVQEECAAENSVDSFPESIFTDDQLRQGAFLLYVLFGIYAFTLLAIVCNDYFIPCVEFICEDLKIPQNVAAATFMSVATSCPEFFVNVISTFITESDMGIGTIVGSAIFNALGVAAIGGLAAIAPIKIDAAPVTRDVIIYMINVGVLVAIVWDGQVDWYEAVALGVLYILYFVVMFNSMRLFRLMDKIIAKCCRSNSADISETAVVANEINKSVEEGIDNKAFEHGSIANGINLEKPMVVDGKEDSVIEKPPKSVWRFPMQNSLVYRIWWVYTWPLKFLLTMTIPSPITCRRFYPLAFFMCIVWIGVNSYFVSWSMTVIGNTFFIPESVMGMTFLAFGGCLPEACSIFIMSRRGEGGIGVSNALGANSLAILFALGVPWLIRTVALEVQGAEQTAVLINSSGIDFVVGSLLVVACCLWITLFIGKFTLRKSIGGVFTLLYLFFITFAILVEMGIILDREDAFC